MPLPSIPATDGLAIATALVYLFNAPIHEEEVATVRKDPSAHVLSRIAEEPASTKTEAARVLAIVLIFAELDQALPCGVVYRRVQRNLGVLPVHTTYRTDGQEHRLRCRCDEPDRLVVP